MPPTRIQRRRTPGWKKPENTIDVTRPGKYGNQFVVGKYAPDELDEMYGPFSIGNCPPYLDMVDYLSYGIRGHLIEDAETAVRLHRQWLDFLADQQPAAFRHFMEILRGKNIMCWCRVGEPCHGDTLLHLANQ